jgi:hypothetical protein
MWIEVGGPWNLVGWSVWWRGLLKLVNLIWKKTNLKTSRYWEIHGLDQEEDKKIGPAAKKPSTVEQRVDRTPKEGKARETSSLIRTSKETWADWTCNAPLFTKGVSESFEFTRDITTSLELIFDSRIYIFFIKNLKI